MPAKVVTIVGVIADSGLRSALAARVVSAGIDLLTASAYRHLPVRPLRDPTLLVVDEAAIAGEESGWIEGIRDDPRWLRVIVLALDGPKAASGPASLDQLIAELERSARGGSERP
ncbi:MAG: hypothetical protein WDN44_12945 [Sphingomonas sp.]